MYAESRIYVPGDDARHIDWRLSARTGQLHSKLYQAERERVCMLVADTSAPLYFGTQVRFKSVQAARLGAVVAWMALAEGDRIGALRGSRSEPAISPMGGEKGVLRVLDALRRWYAEKPIEDAGLAFALSRLRAVLRPDMQVHVLAEPASIMQVHARDWAALAQQAMVRVFLLADRFEQQPPKVRLPLWQGGGVQWLDLRNPAQFRQWQATFVQPLQQAHAVLAALGISAHTVMSDADCTGWFVRQPFGRRR